MEDKAAYVRTMFARIAGCYDRANMFMTFGRDREWRRLAAKAAECSTGCLALDVATGTGELALAVSELGARVVGVDFCLEMLAVARAKPTLRRAGVILVAGDGLALPFPDDTFDCATTGFSLRNVANVSALLSEMRRVVRPGGRVVCLELIPPDGHVWSWLFRIYSHGVAPLLARLAGGEAEAYRYLPDSVDRFLSADELRAIMEEVGLQQVRYRRLNLGSVALHVGVK